MEQNLDFMGMHCNVVHSFTLGNPYEHENFPAHQYVLSLTIEEKSEQFTVWSPEDIATESETERVIKLLDYITRGAFAANNSFESFVAELQLSAAEAELLYEECLSYKEKLESFLPSTLTLEGLREELEFFVQ